MNIRVWAVTLGVMFSLAPVPELTHMGSKKRQDPRMEHVCAGLPTTYL